MKYIRILAAFLILCLSINLNTFSQDLGIADVRIHNSTGSAIEVKIYPVSMVFNGYDQSSGISKYDLTAKRPNILFKFIGATNKDLQGGWKQIGPYAEWGGNYDFHVLGGEADQFSVGFGIYKFEVKQGSWIDTFWVEWDYKHDQNHLYNMGFDLRLFVYLEEVHKIKFYWYDYGMPETMIDNDPNHDFNKYLKGWEQLNSEGEFISRPKDIGVNKFIYDGSHGMPFPQDSRRDCYIPGPPIHDKRQCFISDLGGVLSNYLSISTSVTTPESFARSTNSGCNIYNYYARNITVLPGACLLINNNITFTMREYQNTTNAAKMTLKGPPPGNLPSLMLMAQSNLRVKRNSTLILDCYSEVVVGQYAHLILESGSIFCNLGGRISEQGTFENNGCGSWWTCPLISCPDNYFSDSIKFINETGAEFLIPDSTTYIFEGNETALICKDSSSILFGKGAKLIFRDGARIKANNTKFTSIDSTQTWDGIYLESSSNDTLKYCTIQNAVNGINVKDKV